MALGARTDANTGICFLPTVIVSSRWASYGPLMRGQFVGHFVRSEHRTYRHRAQ
jgi:hypothetical protein